MERSDGAWSRSVMPWRQRARSSSLRDSSADASSNPWRMRSRSSAAAASVNVMAAIRSRVALPVVTRFTTRPTRLAVLPVPALASTNSVSSNARR